MLIFSGDFFLTDYISKLGNFNQPYVETAFTCEGYYDCYNYDASVMKSAGKHVMEKRRTSYHATVDEKTNKKTYIYEFILIPSLGFLAESTPLLNDCEIRLNFDRASPETAILAVGSDKTAPDLEIKECFMTTEWVSSPALKNYFSDISYNPITYQYDEVEVLIKPLPPSMTTIRLDNLKGGNIPTYIFAGIIATESLDGSLTSSSSNFACNNVTEMSISLNGFPCNGYPISIKNESDTNALFQFNDTVGRIYNNKCCAGLKKPYFSSNFIWAYHFEAEETSQGWIGIDMKLSKAFTKSHTMVIWLVNPTSVSIDKYHQIERTTY